MSIEQKSTVKHPNHPYVSIDPKVSKGSPVIRGTRAGELSVPAECFVTIRLYFDEDSMDRDLTKALQARGVDLATALDAGMLEREDEEQLDYAIAQGRVLYSFNIGDFHRLHTTYLAGDKSRGYHPVTATTLLRRRADASSAKTNCYKVSGGDEESG